MKLYIYTTPAASRVGLILDSGFTFTADTPTTANGRDDAHALELPNDTPDGQGALLEVQADGCVAFSGRGIVRTADDVGLFLFDDVHLQPIPAPPVPPGPPKPPNPGDPFGVCVWIYEQGGYNLATLDGCGSFTEACAATLFAYTSPMWGHVAKHPGQNQYHGHAVDAIHCLGGEYAGIWDIITSSVSPEAAPAFNYAGDPDPSIWYPGNLTTPPAVTSTAKKGKR